MFFFSSSRFLGLSVNLRLVQLSSRRNTSSTFSCVLRVGFPLRFVFAILRSSLSLIDLAIWRDAPLSDDLELLASLRRKRSAGCHLLFL